MARLAPQDYHRWHSPISGVVQGVREIDGTYYTVNPQAINESGAMDVFCENKRSVMLLQPSQSKAAVAVVAVGAMLVGSIRYDDGIQQGAEVERGQCLGGFYYGGSTVIVVFGPGEVELDGDLVRNSEGKGADEGQACETLVRVGERIGECVGK